MYKKLTKEHTGVLTGKGLSFGGSLARTEATGFGLVYFTSEMLKKYKNDSFKGKKVIVSGCGNVAKHAALKAYDLGATVVAMSNIQGYLYDENGLDVYKIKEISDKTINVIDEYKKLHPNVITGENKHDIWKIKCDIALPCATQNEINLEDAKELVKNGCKILAEGANMPTELDAIK